VRGSPNDAFRRLVARAVETRAPILGSVDSHAWDAWEFASNDNHGPAGEDPRFPDHCVKGTPGWLKVPGTLPPRFRFVPCVASPDAERLAGELSRGETQALYFEKEVYSLFVNPLADAVVRAVAASTADPTFVVFGVATDYCVRAAALGLAERGLRVELVVDAIAAVDPAGGERALEEVARAGVRGVRLEEVFA
jgi:nicotinamidase/pyrazinamidase